MAQPESQAFLRELDKQPWTAADSRSEADTGGAKLRSNLAASVYSRAERDRPTDRADGRVNAGADGKVNAGAFINHAVIGLIFLKSVSDSFARRQAEIRGPKSACILSPKGCGKAPSDECMAVIRAELEERDDGIEMNVFRVPALGAVEDHAGFRQAPRRDRRPGGGKLEIAIHANLKALNFKP